MPGTRPNLQINTPIGPLASQHNNFMKGVTTSGNDTVDIQSIQDMSEPGFRHSYQH